MNKVKLFVLKAAMVDRLRALAAQA